MRSESFQVDFIDKQFSSGISGGAVPSPIELIIDDNRLRDDGGVVSSVQRQVPALVARFVREEQTVLIADLPVSAFA